MNVFKLIKAKVFNLKLKRAIKKANQYASLTGSTFLVLLYKKRIVVKSRRTLKTMIHRGELKTTIQQLDKIALYSTRR